MQAINQKKRHESELMKHLGLKTMNAFRKLEKKTRRKIKKEETNNE